MKYQLLIGHALWYQSAFVRCYKILFTAITNALIPKVTAAVVCLIYHIPYYMPAVCSILEQRPSVLLIEDCSHAHGAEIHGTAVGAFGDGAAWSLQDR